MIEAQPHCCQEAALGMGDAYIPCNRPATKVVGWRGRSDPPLRMCAGCADHNVRNRGGVALKDYKADDPDQTYLNPKYAPGYSGSPSLDVADALSLPILFYTIDWTPEKKAAWLRVTGSAEASTKVMCDHLRSVLAVREARPADPNAIAVECLKSLSESVQGLPHEWLGEAAEKVREAIQNAFDLGYEAAGGMVVNDAERSKP